MELIKIITIALTGVMVATLTKNINKEMSIYIVLAAVIMILLIIIGKLSDIFIIMENIYENVTYGRDFFPVIIKVLAVAYITDFTAQICKDAGENTIGSKVELAGKVTIFYLAMPIFTAILELIKQLLS